MPVLAVYGDHIARLQDVVAVEQFAGGRVPRDVNLGVALVHDGRAELGQAVDDAVDRVLVPRNQARGEDDRVALADLDAVLEVRHAREDGHRLALRSGAHVDDAIVRQLERDLEVDQHPLGNLEVAELRGDAHVAHHAAADQGDLASVRDRGIQHLLDAVDVTGEARHDHPTRGLRDDPLEDRPDVALERCEAGHVGVGRIGEEQIDALFAEPSEGAQVGDAIVERELVHLEVAGVEDETGAGPDGDRERIRDRVVHRDELEAERADLLVLALPHRQRVRRDPVLFELRLDERQCQLRPDQRDVAAQLEQIGNGADVVLVTVGEHHADHVIEPIP